MHQEHGEPRSREDRPAGVGPIRRSAVPRQRRPSILPRDATIRSPHRCHRHPTAQGDRSHVPRLGVVCLPRCDGKVPRRRRADAGFAGGLDAVPRPVCRHGGGPRIAGRASSPANQQIQGSDRSLLFAACIDVIQFSGAAPFGPGSNDHHLIFDTADGRTVAILAGPFLGEWIGWRRAIAIGIGFAGILVALRPGLTAVHYAFAFSLAGMLSYAVFSLVTRYLASYDPAEVTLFYSLLAGSIVMAPFALAEWQWPSDTFVWFLLMSMGF